MIRPVDFQDFTALPTPFRSLISERGQEARGGMAFRPEKGFDLIGKTEYLLLSALS